MGIRHTRISLRTEHLIAELLYSNTDFGGLAYAARRFFWRLSQLEKFLLTVAEEEVAAWPVVHHGAAIE